MSTNCNRRHTANTPRVRAWCVFAVCALLGLDQTPLVAADPVAPTPLEQQIESLLGPRSPAAESQPRLAQIPTEMQQAGDELRSRQADAALTRQREILTQLDELLATAAPQSAQQPSNEPMTGETAGVGPDHPGENGSESGAPADGLARESNSSATGSRPAASVLERRRHLATAVWGHLPDREREEMLQTYREEFLPDYADLVERYYEALAAERLKSPAQAGPALGP